MLLAAKAQWNGCKRITYVECNRTFISLLEFRLFFFFFFSVLLFSNIPFSLFDFLFVVLILFIKSKKKHTAYMPYITHSHKYIIHRTHWNVWYSQFSILLQFTTASVTTSIKTNWGGINWILNHLFEVNSLS